MLLATKISTLTGHLGRRFSTVQRVSWVQRSRRSDALSSLRCGQSYESLLGSSLLNGWNPLRHLTTKVPTCRSSSGSDESGSTGDNFIELEINVEGMMCDGCSSRIEASLQAMSGVRRAVVSLENKLATVDVAAVSQLDALAILPLLVTEIQSLGFEASPHIEYSPGVGQ